jgi:hypothetical protein
MSENFYISFTITMAIAGVVVLAGLGLNHCDNRDEVSLRTQQQLEHNAQELRLEYVRKCIPPDMAERLAPTPLLELPQQ